MCCVCRRVLGTSPRPARSTSPTRTSPSRTSSPWARPPWTRRQAEQIPKMYGCEGWSRELQCCVGCAWGRRGLKAAVCLCAAGAAATDRPLQLACLCIFRGVPGRLGQPPSSFGPLRPVQCIWPTGARHSLLSAAPLHLRAAPRGPHALRLDISSPQVSAQTPVRARLALLLGPTCPEPGPFEGLADRLGNACPHSLWTWSRYPVWRSEQWAGQAATSASMRLQRWSLAGAGWTSRWLCT